MAGTSHRRAASLASPQKVALAKRLAERMAVEDVNMLTWQLDANVLSPHNLPELRLSKLKTMPTISMVMQKGGSGKSTLATQLAVYAQQQGQRPLIVDLDPQRSAVVWSDLRQGRSPEAVPSLPSRL